MAVENLGCGGYDLRWGFYAVDRNRLSGDEDHDWLMITWWKGRLEESCVQEGRCEASKGGKERKTRGVKTFSELAPPMTSAYVYLSGHTVRAHPASSAAIKLPFPTMAIRYRIIRQRSDWRYWGCSWTCPTTMVYMFKLLWIRLLRALLLALLA